MTSSSPHPDKKGCPDGHALLYRFMSVPIFEGDRIVAVAAVANKREQYDASDARQVTLLLDGMWKVVQRKKAEEALRESEERLCFLLPPDFWQPRRRKEKDIERASRQYRFIPYRHPLRPGDRPQPGGAGQFSPNP